ncbi:MAG: diguanylate cyclase [Oscillospiraceae bacterium]|nr:diguanylate cyclase [Oscillospiraceae bacterium]
MLDFFLQFAIILAFAMSAFVGVVTLYYGQSEKKNNFLLCILSMLLFSLGYMLEMMGNSAGELLAAQKVLHTGSSFVGVFMLFFVVDFCDIKMPNAAKGALVVLSTAITVLVWTTGTHHLVIATYARTSRMPAYLYPVPGIMYYVVHVYPMLCLAASAVAICTKIPKHKGNQRRKLNIILLCVLTPILAELICVIGMVFLGANERSVYYTPHSLAIMGVLLFIGVIRFDMFDIVPQATMQAIDAIAEAYVLLDERLRLLYANPAARALFPDTEHLEKGAHITKIRDWPRELLGIQRSWDKRVVDFARQDANGVFSHYRVSLSSVTSRRSNAWVVLIQDVTASVNLMRRLEEAAYTDTLTEIYNRRHFTELALPTIDKAMRDKISYYVMILDLDFFKRVNDEHGHLAGDAVLKMTAAKIKNTIRSYDLLARYGGEEFILLLTSSDDNGIRTLAERIRRNIEEAECDAVPGITIRVTCSIGVARCDVKVPLEEITEKADKALYWAKEHGRNQVHFAGDMENEAECAIESAQL